VTDWLERLTIDPELVTRLLTRFIRQEVGRFGFTRAVVNLSGGLDSATACALAARALEPENILALRLPYRTSNPDSLSDAQVVIDWLGLASETADITPMVEPFLERFPDMTTVRRGNVMARARMIILYDRSEAWQGLAVGTSNKTELLLGYGTLFGDMASAVNPLGDLYKTQERRLARYLGVPEQILNKPASADLWAGQTDEGELGFTYAEADQILFLLVDERYRPQEVVAEGFASEVVEAVWGRVQSSQFKRRPPVVAKISRRTVGVDFRYARDWGT
jgi:NAD+ synthase